MRNINNKVPSINYEQVLESNTLYPGTCSCAESQVKTRFIPIYIKNLYKKIEPEFTSKEYYQKSQHVHSAYDFQLKSIC